MSKPTKVPGIPEPPADVSPGLRGWLTSVAEALEIRLGRRGDPKDRAVTLRELIEGGLAKDLKSTRFDPNNINSGNRGIGPVEVTDSSVPPAPTSFAAAAAYSQVNLSWDYPNYGNHSYAEIYGHDSDTIGDAQLIGVSSGRVYADPIGSDASRYYWIRFVSTSNIIGPFNSSTGTLATTAADVEHLLDVLTDAITESELATTLQTEIDKISGDANVTGSVAAQVAAEATARATAVSAEASARATAISSSADVLQAQLNDLTGIAAWDSAESYSIDDKVRHDDKLWSAEAANSNSEPTYSNNASTNSDWELTGDYTSLASVTADNSAAITAINNVSTDSTSAAAVAIKALNGEVFAADGTSLLATGSALSGLTTDVRDIYTEADGDDPASGLLASAQASITSLNGEVFAADGSSLLATGTAVSGLTTDVRNIYTAADDSVDPAIPASGILASVQSDVTDLNAEVFSADGASLLATGQSVTSLTNNVNSIYDADGGQDADGNVIPSGVVATAQAAITSLNGAVFDNDGDVKLALGSAVSTLTSDVEAIYDADGGVDADGNAVASGLLASAQSSITALQGAVFDEDNGVKLAEASAVEILETEVYGDGSSGASRIDGLYTALYDDDGALFASASALETLDSAVTGDGGIASKVSNIAAAMYTDSDTTGTSLFATSANLDTVTAQVFPDGLTETSRIAQLSSALYTDGDPDEGVKLASADFVSNINTAVFGDGTTQTASANKIDTLQVIVEGTDGNGGIKNAIETTQEIVGDSTSGLQAQYTVKIDSNGHVAGFGLANTTTAAGDNTSEFLVNADRFAITPNLTSTAPAFVVLNSYSTGDYVTHGDKLWRFKLLSNGQPVSNYTVNHANLGPGGSSGSAALLWEEAGQTPFSVVAASTTVDGVYIPTGVYMDTAFIRDATITAAQIGSINANTISTGSLNVTDLIQTNAIEASKLSIDSNFLAENSSGELILQTGDATRGVKFENLSQDAVGVLASAVMASPQTLSNQTLEPYYFTETTPYSTYTASDSYGINTTHTLAELLTLNLSHTKIRETGTYFVDFGADPFGTISSSSTTSASAVFLDVYRKYKTSSTYSFVTSRSAGASYYGSNPLTVKIGKTSFALSVDYDYQFKLYGHIKGFSDSTVGSQTKGMQGGHIRIIRIHKAT